MCDCCRPPAGFMQCRSNCRSHDICLPPQQWQSLEVPCNSNHATTTIQTQTCHHHTQTQSQSLTRIASPTNRILTYNPDTFHCASPAPSPCSYQQTNHNHHRTLESLLRDLLNHTICNTHTVLDCAACHALCHAPSQTQREPQQCNACNADHQQLVSLLINLLERINTNTWPHNHDHKMSPTCRLQPNRHQQARCDCLPCCDTCIAAHEQTKNLIDVLFRITRRRSRGRTHTRTSTRYRRCTRSRSPFYTRSSDNDLCRVVRRLLDGIESGNSMRCCHGCGAADCRGYLDGSVSRLRKVVREIEDEADEFDEDAGCGCGRGEDCVEISRVTTYNRPERRRPRVGNLHLGWVL